MARINHFINQPGANYIDNSESIISISPEGTKIISDIHTEKAEENALHQEVPKDNKENTTENTIKQMTNRQVVILMATLLDISLSPNYTNQKQFSLFISRITGRSAESIRHTIMDDAKKGWDTDQAREDMCTVANVLEPISKKLADRLRSNAQDV